MKVRALVSFSGAFSMCKGEVKECNNEFVLQDLLNAKYIEKVDKPKTNKKVKANEN